MKFTKTIALSIALLTVAGAQADWLETISGYLGQGTAPASVPAQIQTGQATTDVAASGQVAKNLETIKNTIVAMIPAVRDAVATKDVSKLAGLASQGKSLATSAQAIVSEIQSHPSIKSAFAANIQSVSGVVKMSADQIRTIGQSSDNFFVKNGVKLLAFAIEQIPGLLQMALR